MRLSFLVYDGFNFSIVKANFYGGKSEGEVNKERHKFLIT